MGNTITIPLGATVVFVWPDGGSNTYIFRGEDDHGLFFEDEDGQRSSDPLKKAYATLTVVAP